MKLFVKILSVCAIILCFGSLNIQNTFANNQINQLSLIEEYLILHKDKIVSYATKYNFVDSKNIQDGLKKIDNIINSLRQLQNNGNDNKATSIILNEIKKVNEEMKVLLNAEKIKYDKVLQTQKSTYNNLGKKLSSKIDQIYSMIYPAILQKNELTEKEARLKDSLKVLSILSKELKDFGYKDFDTIEQMQTSFLGTLNSIKYYLLVMKENLK